MAKVKVEVEVSKEAYELGKAVSEVVKSVKEALKDGFDPMTDVPAIVVQSLSELKTGIEGVQLLGEESKEDIEAFINAWLLSGTDIAGEFLKKEV
jgi:hypothetical protein